MQSAELGSFLRARREATDPIAAGFPAGGRRRTPGLRREELAQLAGVSVTWYTWLEQARDITVSRQVIESLARALRLSTAERDYVFTLAGLAQPPVGPREPEVDPTLRRLVDVLQPNPAYVAGLWWDLLVYNKAYADLLGGLDQRPPDERNILWITFIESRGAGLFVDWEAEARSLAGQLRVTLSKHPEDPRGAALLQRLLAADGTFRRLWESRTVTPSETSRKHLVHPRLGRIDLDYTKLAAPPDLSLIVFLPADESSAARLVV